MAIAFFGSVTVDASTTGDHTAHSFSHTVPAGQSNTILVVLFAALDGDDVVSGTPTYGGQNLTSAGVQSRSTGLANGHTDIWYLLDPPTGSNTLAFNHAASGACNVICAQYSGVNQSDPLGGTDTTVVDIAANTIATTVTIENAGGVHLHVASFRGGDGSPALKSVGTERVDGTSGGTSPTGDNSIHFVEHAPGGTGANTITTTWSASDLSAASAIELLPSTSQTIGSAESSHNHSADAEALAQTQNIAEAEAAHAHTAGAPKLTVGVLLEQSSASHGHSVEVAQLAQAQTVAEADATHSHSGDAASVPQSMVKGGRRVTRLGLYGGARPIYVFNEKRASTGFNDKPWSYVTRLGLYGGPRPVYKFNQKGAAAAAGPEYLIYRGKSIGGKSVIDREKGNVVGFKEVARRSDV